MKKVAAFGIGRNWLEHGYEICEQYEVVCLADNDINKIGVNHGGKKILSMKEMLKESFDFVLVIPHRHKMEIIRGLLDAGVRKEQIIPWMPSGGRSWKEYGISVDDDCCYAHFDEIRFICCTTDDFMILEEVFLYNAYDFFVGERDAIVIDVGMNVGLASLFFAHQKNVRKVYSFEPFLKTFHRAMDNIKLNVKPIQEKIVAANIALGNSDAEYAVEYNQDCSGGISILHPSKSENEGEMIRVCDAGREIRKILKSHRTENIIMKIDTEGSEYNIFSSMEKEGILDDIHVFLVETHDNRENELKDTLKKHGFAYFDHIHVHDCGMLYAINLNMVRDHAKTLCSKTG